MDPEEPLVPPFAVTLADCLARVLIQELSDHGLGDGMDDIRIGGLIHWLSDRTHVPVACFADYARIATVRRCNGVVAVLDCPSGALRQSIETGMKIQDMRIVDDIIVVMDFRTRLAWWDPETGRRVHSGRAAVDAFLKYFTLSRDCSQVAFIQERGTGPAVCLRRVEPPEAIASLGPHHAENVIDIRFSPDQRELWLLKCVKDVLASYHITKLEIARNGGGRRKVIRGDLEDKWSWVNLFSFGYHIGVTSGAGWIKDSGGAKIFWLPPDWRSADPLQARWDESFLALVDRHRPVPIVIGFQP